MVTRVEAGPVENEDRWILGLRGLGVTRIGVDFQLTLTLTPPPTSTPTLGPDTPWQVVLETPFHLSQGTLRANPALLLTPESQDVAAALPLFGATVLSAVAFIKSGALRIVFDDGTHLNCSADPAFEAWSIIGPRGWRFVAAAGGGLAVWPGSASI